MHARRRAVHPFSPPSFEPVEGQPGEALLLLLFFFFSPFFFSLFPPVFEVVSASSDRRVFFVVVVVFLLPSLRIYLWLGLDGSTRIDRFVIRSLSSHFQFLRRSLL